MDTMLGFTQDGRDMGVKLDLTPDVALANITLNGDTSGGRKCQFSRADSAPGIR